MFFYGFILVQFGAIDFILKGLVPDQGLPLGSVYPAFTFFSGNRHVDDFNCGGLGLSQALY